MKPCLGEALNVHYCPFLACSTQAFTRSPKGVGIVKSLVNLQLDAAPSLIEFVSLSFLLLLA